MKRTHSDKSRNVSSRNALKLGFAARLWVRDDGPRLKTLTGILAEGRSRGLADEAVKRAAAARSELEQIVLARDKLFNAIHELFLIPEAEVATSDNSKKLESYCKQLSRLERYEKQATVRWERSVAELEAAHYMKTATN